MRRIPGWLWIAVLTACVPTDSTEGMPGGVNFAQLLWLFFLISTLQPIINQRLIAMRRVAAIRSLEQRRGTRVITLIHRQEGLSLFGIPFARYIDIDDSEKVLRAIELTDPNVGIDLIIHTPGGLVLASEQIAHALKAHGGKVTVFVPHYAMSGGTLIALAADEIVMAPSAVLGPVDPQIGDRPAASIVSAVELKTDINEVDDQTLILADVARKALRQVNEFVESLLAERMPADQAKRVADQLTQGHWTHDYPFLPDRAKELGLPVSLELPGEVRELMQLYPQPRGRRPSVEYIPLPYRAPDAERPGRGRPLRDRPGD